MLDLLPEDPYKDAPAPNGHVNDTAVAARLSSAPGLNPSIFLLRLFFIARVYLAFLYLLTCPILDRKAYM
jgi:hypothetical protein